MSNRTSKGEKDPAKKAAVKRPVTKKKRGRPVEAIPNAVARAVTDWIAKGGTLSDFCKKEGTPDRRTITSWRLKDEDFSSRMGRARDAGIDEMAERLLAMVRTPVDDPLELQRVKLEVDLTMKLLGKWDNRYGVKVAVEHTVDDKIGDVLEAARLRVLARTSRMVNPVDEEGGDLVE